MHGGWMRPGERALFTLEGPDAARYLNGQLSCNILRVPPGTARTGCLLTAKGKLCAHVHVWAGPSSFFLECESILLDDVQARLEKYLIADDVSVTAELSADPPVHVFGQPAPDGYLRIARLGVEGYDCSAPPDGVPEASPQEIELLRIERGLPVWGRELAPETLVQEARLEESAVDFDKGCYVGQEVVSRLKSVGRVNSRLFGFVGALGEPPASGLVLHPLEHPEMVAGRITSHALHFELAQTVALGYLHRQFDQLGRFTVTDSSGLPLGEVEKREFPII